MMPPTIKQEIKNALWGCLEIPLYLKLGSTRFTGTISAFKRSILVPILLVPVIAVVIPNPAIYADKSVLWTTCLLWGQATISTLLFIVALYFFRSKHVTTEQFLRCITGYNWLSLSALVVNIPLILLAYTGVNTWSDVFAMMILIALYSSSYLAFMITYTLRINGYLGAAFAIMDLMLGEVVRNLTTYWMLHNV